MFEPAQASEVVGVSVIVSYVTCREQGIDYLCGFSAFTAPAFGVGGGAVCLP